MQSSVSGLAKAPWCAGAPAVCHSCRCSEVPQQLSAQGPVSLPSSSSEGVITPKFKLSLQLQFLNPKIVYAATTTHPSAGNTHEYKGSSLTGKVSCN